MKLNCTTLHLKMNANGEFSPISVYRKGNKEFIDKEEFDSLWEKYHKLTAHYDKYFKDLGISPETIYNLDQLSIIKDKNKVLALVIDILRTTGCSIKKEDGKFIIYKEKSEIEQKYEIYHEEKI